MATIFSGRNGSINALNAATPTDYTTPALTMVAALTNKVYRVATAQADKRFIDPASAMTVKYDTVVKTKGTDYIVSGPAIINISAATPTAVTIEAFKYFVTAAQANVKEWQLDVNYDTEAVNYINDSGADAGWKRKVGMFTGGTVTVSRYYDATQSPAILATLANKLWALNLQIDSTGPKRYECYGYLNSESIKNVSNGTVDEDLKFDIVGRVYYFST